MYLSSLPLTKISILLFYLRIFPSRKIKLAVYVLIALNLGYLISFVLVSIWQCRPISLAWTRWDGEHAGSCNNINLQGWTSAAFNIVLDVCTLALPLPELYALKMSARKKLQVLSMFSVGFLYASFLTFSDCQLIHDSIASPSLAFSGFKLLSSSHPPRMSHVGSSYLTYELIQYG
jgi:hypothetical protein